MDKKFELTDETIVVDGRTLHRIKSLKNFNDVKKGDLGGFIEKEQNLSHEGNCWIYDNARVFDNARVYGNAHVSDNTRIYGNARVSGNVSVSDNTRIYGNARVCDNAHVYGNAWVHGGVNIYDNMRLCSGANIESFNDICYISLFGSRNEYTTFFRCKDSRIKVKCGCFTGTLDEFRNKVKETHGDNQYAKEYLLAADLVELRLNRKNEVE